MFAFVFRLIKFLVRLVVILLSALCTIEILREQWDKSGYSICKTIPHRNVESVEHDKCIRCRGEVVCDEQTSRNLALEAFAGLMDGAEAFKESKLTAGVKKGGNGMQKEMQDIVGIGGSSIVGDDVEWKGAGVKGVRVKKVEEEGAAHRQDEALPAGALEVEL